MLNRDIPIAVYEVFLSILCIGAIAFYVWKGFRRSCVFTIRLLFVELLCFIYGITVFCRETRNYIKYDFHPFWSYKAILEGRVELLAENVLNVMAFIPVGMLLRLGFSRLKWWETISLGCLISISIESLQFVFKRGFCEVDDVMNNTIGCAIGYGGAKLIAFAYFAYVKQCRLV